MALLPVFVTPFPEIPPTSEEATGVIYKTSIDVNHLAFYLMFYCFISSLNFFLFLSQSSCDLMILIVLSISLFELNKVNPFPALNLLP